jgi:hypothetical protein
MDDLSSEMAQKLLTGIKSHDLHSLFRVITEKQRMG